MEQPTQLIIALGHILDVDIACIIYNDPVIDDWIVWGDSGVAFRSMLLVESKTDWYRQYHPYQMPLLDGFRKLKGYINTVYNHPTKGAIPIIVDMLRASGYNLLMDEPSSNITLKQLDDALRARPDLYERREMKDQ